MDAAGHACVAVKPQLACFERLGSEGWRALEAVVAAGRERGLLVLADGKRGDVPVSARAYAQALVGETPGPFGTVKGLGVDAFTASPLLGRDALEPLLEAADAAGAGCFCLVHTSNPGASEIQDEPEAEPLYERLARMVSELGERRRGRGAARRCLAIGRGCLTRGRAEVPSGRRWSQSTAVRCASSRPSLWWPSASPRSSP